MDDITRKAKEWARIMDAHREMGLKHVAPEHNPYLYDDDWDEIARLEQADHEAKKRAREQARQDRAERRAADKAARKLDKGKP